MLREYLFWPETVFAAIFRTEIGASIIYIDDALAKNLKRLFGLFGATHHFTSDGETSRQIRHCVLKQCPDLRKVSPPSKEHCVSLDVFTSWAHDTWRTIEPGEEFILLHTPILNYVAKFVPLMLGNDYERILKDGELNYINSFFHRQDERENHTCNCGTGECKCPPDCPGRQGKD